MKTVITGAAGFLGASLARQLHLEGYQLTLIDNLRHGSTERLLDRSGKYLGSLHTIDIRHPDLYRCFEGAEVIYHLAAISNLAECQADPVEAYSVNVGGTANVLEAARKVGCPMVVFASTSAIYENTAIYPTKETDPIQPDLVYAMTKKAAEDLVLSYYRNYRISARVLRYANIYGPLQSYERKTPPLVNNVINHLLCGKSPVIYGHGEQRRDYLFVDDAIEATIRASDLVYDLEEESINIGSGKSYSINEVVQTIRAVINDYTTPIEYQSPQDLWDDFPSLYEGEFPFCTLRVAQEAEKRTHLDISRARRELVWEPQVSLYQGITYCVEQILKEKGYTLPGIRVGKPGL